MDIYEKRMAESVSVYFYLTSKTCMLKKIRICRLKLEMHTLLPSAKGISFEKKNSCINAHTYLYRNKDKLSMERSN